MVKFSDLRIFSCIQEIFGWKLEENQKFCLYQNIHGLPFYLKIWYEKGGHVKILQLEWESDIRICRR